MKRLEVNDDLASIKSQYGGAASMLKQAGN